MSGLLTNQKLILRPVRATASIQFSEVRIEHPSLLQKFYVNKVVW